MRNAIFYLFIFYKQKQQYANTQCFIKSFVNNTTHFLFYSFVYLFFVLFIFLMQRWIELPETKLFISFFFAVHISGHLKINTFSYSNNKLSQFGWHKL